MVSSQISERNGDVCLHDLLEIGGCCDLVWSDFSFQLEVLSDFVPLINNSWILISVVLLISDEDAGVHDEPKVVSMGQIDLEAFSLNKFFRQLDLELKVITLQSFQAVEIGTSASVLLNSTVKFSESSIFEQEEHTLACHIQVSTATS